MKKRSFSRSGVSPVIATILMVAITVVISGVLLILVLNIIDQDNISPTGVMEVEKLSDDPDIYSIRVKIMTFKLPSNDLKFSVNDETTFFTLDRYPASKPYQGQGFKINAGDTVPNDIGTGAVFNLEITGIDRGERIKAELVRSNGVVIASVTFVDPKEVVRPTLDLTGIEYNDGQQAEYPLVFDMEEEQFIRVPQSNVPEVTRYLKISVELILDKPPAEQSSWASIVNINGDRGYRLQLSGESNGNQWFEFGANNSWVRSDGTGGGVEAIVKENIVYEVWGIFDFEKREVSVWVNSTDGETMVMAGIRNYNSENLPNIGSGDWYLGTWGTSVPTRGFIDGTINWINVEAL